MSSVICDTWRHEFGKNSSPLHSYYQTNIVIWEMENLAVTSKNTLTMNIFAVGPDIVVKFKFNAKVMIVFCRLCLNFQEELE